MGCIEERRPPPLRARARSACRAATVPGWGLVALALTGCAAATDSRGPGAAAPPPLVASFTDAEDLHFRRIVTSVARNEALRVKGHPDGVDLRAEADYRVSTRGGAEGELPTLELQTADCSFEGRGVAGDVSFDTRRPESLRALAGVKGGPTLLQAVESARSDPQRVRLDADGAPQVPDVVAAGATVGLRIGWIPGTLPFGDLQGRVVPGAQWKCAGVLRAADAGLRYNDPLVVSGTWRVAEWDADSGVARLALEGGAEFDDSRLRTTRVESCELRGEATWSAARRLVTRSRVTATVALREREGRPVRIDWTVTLAEDLVE